jgi:hypothetical protein
MTLTTTRGALQDWARWPRPLAALTKEQLWKYPLADPSADAEWEFSKEVMQRLMAYRGRQAEADTARADVDRAARMLSTAELNLVRAKDKGPEAQLHGEQAQHAALIQQLENAVQRAKVNAQRAQEQAAKLQRSLDQIGGVNELISDTEIQSYYTRRYAGEWNRIMQAWQEGTLLDAQKYGFYSFLHVRGEQQRTDVRAYKQAEGIANLVGQMEGPTFLAMRALYQIRVMPSLQERRAFLADNEADGEIQVAALKPEQRKKYWEWWRAYNSMTLRYQWTDDSGVAYDDRMFNPNKLRPEERDDD